MERTALSSLPTFLLALLTKKSPIYIPPDDLTTTSMPLIALAALVVDDFKQKKTKNICCVIKLVLYGQGSYFRHAGHSWSSGWLNNNLDFSLQIQHKNSLTIVALKQSNYSAIAI